MPILLHQLLMFIAMFVAFFVCGFVAVGRRGALVAAGVPEWLVWGSPFLAVFGSTLLFFLIPARCPGCGWPVAFLRFTEKLMYRCARCRHIHLTMWGASRKDARSPGYSRVWLPALRPARSNEQRITFSGHLIRPSTLLLVISPTPTPGKKAELEMSVEACLINEQGETLLRVEGPLKEWGPEPWWTSLRSSLGLRHPEWRDVAVRGVDWFALEIRIHNAGPDGQFQTLRPALEFLHFGGASRFVGPRGGG